MTAPRLTRTYLAVPAHRARMVQGAAASAADAVFMDLEDAVPPAERRQRWKRRQRPHYPLTIGAGSPSLSG